MVGIAGKYRLDQRLGGGGMAEVFLASTVGAEGFSRKVAIKRVLPGFSDNPQFAQMFVDEAQISSRLQHPNIVSVLDFDRDAEQRLFLVMELVEGKDLDALNSTGLLPFPALIFVISEMLRGLGYAHDLPTSMPGEMRGVVHRDVSPHNVLLSWEGAVKVSDFGIAKARSASSATASVFIKGKPAYMSPEQANGEALDGRSDLFAVGVMLWEMLTGRRLFVGEDTRSTLAAVLFGQVPRPRSVRGEVPKDLERVTMKLLEREKSARYASAEAAIDDLLECADAPKNGREMLTKLLAERFPQQAPVRQSLLRVRSTPQQPVPGQAVHERATIADGNAGRSAAPAAPTVPAGAMPSVSSVMQARTGTIDQKPAGKAGKIAIVGGVTVASGVLAFVLVSQLGGKKSKSVPQDAAVTAMQPADAAVAVTAPIDAAVVVAPIDAEVAKTAPPPDAAVTVAATEKKYGRLIVRAFPVLTVYLDSKKLGDTPIDSKFPVGKHTLRLVNVESGKEERVPVTITDAKPTTIERIP